MAVAKPRPKPRPTARRPNARPKKSRTAAKPMNANKKSVNANKKPVNANKKPVNANKKPVNANNKPVNSKKKPVNANSATKAAEKVVATQGISLKNKFMALLVIVLAYKTFEITSPIIGKFIMKHTKKITGPLVQAIRAKLEANRLENAMRQAAKKLANAKAKAKLKAIAKAARAAHRKAELKRNAYLAVSGIGSFVTSGIGSFVTEGTGSVSLGIQNILSVAYVYTIAHTILSLYHGKGIGAPARLVRDSAWKTISWLLGKTTFLSYQLIKQLIKQMLLGGGKFILGTSLKLVGLPITIPYRLIFKRRRG